MALIAAALLLHGCASAPPSSSPADIARREAVLETALGQIGRPYRYGGGDGDGFDCSGLVNYVYSDAGLKLPRTAALLRDYGRSIHLDDAAPGDLVFYSIGGALHVTIFIGQGRVVHAPRSGEDVGVTSVDAPYWKAHYDRAVRILR